MFLVLVLCLSMIPTSAMAEAAGGSAAAGQEELTTGDPAGAETPSECLSLDAPESITYTEDLTITANVTTEGAVTYKWFEDDTELTGQTGETLTLKDTRARVLILQIPSLRNTETREIINSDVSKNY